MYQIIQDNAQRLDSCIIYDRDFDYDYFGFKVRERRWCWCLGRHRSRCPSCHCVWRCKVPFPSRRIVPLPHIPQTLERSYLLRVNGKVVERPQHMLMRVAVGIHMHDIESVIKTYHLMSERWFTHASPTLFNAGTPRCEADVTGHLLGYRQRYSC